MARYDTIESKRLSDALSLIDAATADCVNRSTARLCLLEMVSCMYSGIPIYAYRESTGFLEIEDIDAELAKSLLVLIEGSGIPLSLALSSLARAEMNEVETKKNGAVYTDYRLAAYLAEKAMGSYSGGPVIDTACGTSILLAACAEEWQSSGNDVSSFVSTSVYGIDLSANAVRGSILALSTFLRNASEVKMLAAHFAVKDSLDLGMGVCDCFDVESFALVVGNPPWERVRPSRNEYAKEHGLVVDYGGEIESLPKGYEHRQNESRERSVQLSKFYGLKGGMDLYRAFLALSFMICREGGTIALYLPAGLIRSKSLAGARDRIIRGFTETDVSVFMNRAKFFSIDSRFKFVLATLRRKTKTAIPHDVSLAYCSADDDKVIPTSGLTLDAGLFSDCSGELGAPEVRTEREANVLQRIWLHGCRMREHDLYRNVHPVRELDMTLDRSLFESAAESSFISDGIPIIEGRMVSQFRYGCKEYISGSGRSAHWSIVPPGMNKIAPQFYISKSKLDKDLALRSNSFRVGFCDIAGQTNERAMQAAPIPAGCVCGNKVPTLLFHDEFDGMLWLGIVNSFTFDWVVRRYITTTLNFFILENLPLPYMEREGTLACGIVDHVQRASNLVNDGAALNSSGVWNYAQERAAIDALVFEAYGLVSDDLDAIIADFPLVDQMNSRVSKGLKPTIDLFRFHVTGSFKFKERAKVACERGAIPYLPNEHMRNMMRMQGGV